MDLLSIMDIHVEKHTISTASGSGSSNTNPIIGGICRQLFVSAGTSGTSFRFDLSDEDTLYVRNYDFHRGEINDDKWPFPVRGRYTLRVTDASADGNFTIRMLIQQ